MALKVGEGFDHYTALADLLTRSGFLQWQVVTAVNPTLSFVTGFTGIGKAVRIATTGATTGGGPMLRAVFADRNVEAFIGVRMRMQDITTGNTGSGAWLLFGDSVAGSVQFTVLFNENNYAVQIYRGDGRSGGTLLGASANNAWIGGTGIFIEIGALVDDSAGYVTVKMNGVVLVSLTGIDNKATANAWFDTVDFQPSPVNLVRLATIDLDDLYYADTTSDPGSSANNTFLGDVGTRTLFTTGDSAVDFTPNSGANNYSRVNETAMDSDTSYNHSATPGDEDKFTFGPITNTIALVYGVQVTICARKDDVGPRVIKSGLDSGGTVDYGADHSLAVNYAYFTDMWILDPDTGANWTRTGVNAALGLYNLVS